MAEATAIDDEAVVRRCASIARRARPYGLTVDDSQQAGRIAIWEARRDGRVPDDPVHATRYLHRRALGAMLDMYRTERAATGLLRNAVWGQQQKVSIAPDTVPELSSDREPPDAVAHVRGVIARFMRRASPQQIDVVDRLARDEQPVEIAAALGVTPGRISQIKQEARALFARWL